MACSVTFSLFFVAAHQGTARLCICIHLLAALCQGGEAVVQSSELMRESSEQLQATPQTSYPLQQADLQDGNPIGSLNPDILRQFASRTPDAALHVDPSLNRRPQLDTPTFPGGIRANAAFYPDQRRGPSYSGAVIEDAPLLKSGGLLADLHLALPERLQQIYAQRTGPTGTGLPDETLKLNPYATEPTYANAPDVQGLEGVPGDPAAHADVAQLVFPNQATQATEGETATNLPAAGPDPNQNSNNDPAQLGQALPRGKSTDSAGVTLDPTGNMLRTPTVAARDWQGLLGGEYSNPAGVNSVPREGLLKTPAGVLQGPHGAVVTNPAEALPGPQEEVAAGGQGLSGTGDTAVRYPYGPTSNGIPIFPGLVRRASPLSRESAEGPFAQPQIARLPFCQDKSGIYADPDNSRGFYACDGIYGPDSYRCCAAGQCFHTARFLNAFCLVRPLASSPSTYLLSQHWACKGPCALSRSCLSVEERITRCWTPICYNPPCFFAFTARARFVSPSTWTSKSSFFGNVFPREIGNKCEIHASFPPPLYS